MCSYRRFILLSALVLFTVAVSAQYQDEEAGTIQVQPLEEQTEFNKADDTRAVEIRKAPPGKIQELKNDDDYWYANREPEKVVQKKETVKQKDAGGSGWLQDILWVLILCVFIGAVIWYLASSNASLFRKPSREIIDEPVEEELTDDIFSINYDKEIQKAVAGGNYRLAIRLWYLSTLKELADRHIIDYRHEKTNSDYVAALYGGRYHRDFFRLTRNFEYTWYGQFALSPEAYQMMQTDFSTFKSGLRE